MLYQKELPILGQYDVVVGGGGVAGFCAAMQAARAGARTALVEQYGMLGGIMTGGGNPEIGLFYRGNRPVIAGIGWELVQRLAKAGWASIPEFSAEYAHSQQNVRVNGPMAAAYMDAMCEEAGVHLLLHHTLSDALTEDGRVRGVVLPTKSGLQILKGTIFIDATGDGPVPCDFTGTGIPILKISAKSSSRPSGRGWKRGNSSPPIVGTAATQPIPSLPITATTSTTSP